ncbi:MAG: right-handed parallel beta-helix repeat-containing protein [Terriglobales bacterium]
MVISTIGMYIPPAKTRTFKLPNQPGSTTGGIQEAIDAAAAAGGGTVEIPAGTFVLHTPSGHPALLLKSQVTLLGSGQEKTILKLAGQSNKSLAFLANASYANPDSAKPDHDIVLRNLSIDVNGSEQVVRETRLDRSIPAAGEQEVKLESSEGVAEDSVLVIDAGPKEEVVPVMSARSGSLRAQVMRAHAKGTRVLQILDRLHALVLIGADGVVLEDVTIRNVPKDGIYLSSTLDGVHHSNYCHRITIQRCNFTSCHRNAISVIDADDVTIASNQFNDITGDPGSPVDIEPDYPEQHGDRIVIRDNTATRCSRGVSLSLQLGGATSANFRGESVTGNKIVGTLYGPGILVLKQQAGAKIVANTIDTPATDGIVVVGSSNIEVRQNTIVSPGRCRATGNCNQGAVGVGIRLLDATDGKGTVALNRSKVTQNTIEDTQSPATLLYGVDFSSKGTANVITDNVVSGFDRQRGSAIHAQRELGSNTIQTTARAK